MNPDARALPHWIGVLAADFGIRAALQPLPGELDSNYRVLVAGVPSFVLKVMRAGCEASLVDLQCSVLAHLARVAPQIPIPRVVPARDGSLYMQRADPEGRTRILWLISLLPGRTYAEARPRSADLMARIGQLLGELDTALASFSHPAMRRSFKWNLLESDWIRPHLSCIEDERRRRIVTAICDDFEKSVRPRLAREKDTPIHNDANYHNLLVEWDTAMVPVISGLIDFGDFIAAPAVCELAIAGAYLVLGREHPLSVLQTLTSAYHAVRPLSESELALVYPLLRTRLAVSVVNATLVRQASGDNPYLMVSQPPAWAFLERSERFSEALVHARLRHACGLPVVAPARRVAAFLAGRRGQFAPILPNMEGSTTHKLDLSPSGSVIPENPLAMTPSEALGLVDSAGQSQGSGCGAAGPILLGAYGEPRLLYTEPAFRQGEHPIGDRRTVHLGVDVFAPAGTVVRAPLSGRVEFAGRRPERLDYGAIVVLRHETPEGDPFFTWYGHLQPETVDRLDAGRPVQAGESFAELGRPGDNGGWTPHLHFQVALTTEGIAPDWPGACDPDEFAFWEALCPNPAPLLNLPDDKTRYEATDEAVLLEKRRLYFSSNWKLSYAAPCHLVRGFRQYLFDAQGRPYLDAYNNVPHVGHAHPRIARVAARQWQAINTNSRYLHRAQVEFAEALIARFPGDLRACFFVSTASEGNELALRLARAHTRAKHVIVQASGYHGMTTGAIDISDYKFSGPGGEGKPDWVEVVPIPNTFRGPYRTRDAGVRYPAECDGAILRIHERGGRLAAFIAETFPSVGGQIVPPEGYLPAVYAKVRAAGGVCIADEVQTGLGRLGQHFWGFEQQRVEPDIVVLGKPLGNGHPVAAVVTTRAVADSFANGMEFFSTFGGSTLSCVIGREVLQIIDDEGLPENARVVGSYLLDALRSLMNEFPLIGDVRGMGLFIGVELVQDRHTLAPATASAAYVIHRLREHRILIGRDGPTGNVLKIRPPLPFERRDADLLVERLREILAEGPCACAGR